ncbi:MAG TPA: hypothetical protein VFY84_14210 [Jiangellales bacterium]|nr:hypothetical protein [Jiangellales bacterium]
MTNRFEDLAPLIAPKGIARGSTVGHRQGVVETWNTTTGANTVRVGGTLFTNLPIADSSDLVLIAPGDVVAIRVVSGNSAFATMYVDGRIAIPGSPGVGAAAEFVEDLIDRRTVTNIVATQQTRVPGGGFGDLATVGPSVTIDVRAGGRVLLTLAAFMSHGGAPVSSVSMGFAASGANSITPVLADSLGFGCSNEGWTLGASREFLLTGLTPGSTTFTAKYDNSSSAGNGSWQDRVLTVIAL